MTAPHCHTTEEAKANIRGISHNSGPGDNCGPTSIGGGSVKSMKTSTPDVEPKGGDFADSAPKRGV
jgi:hypothetical protein